LLRAETEKHCKAHKYLPCNLPIVLLGERSSTAFPLQNGQGCSKPWGWRAR